MAVVIGHCRCRNRNHRVDRPSKRFSGREGWGEQGAEEPEEAKEGDGDGRRRASRLDGRESMTMNDDQWEKGLKVVDEVYGPGFSKVMEPLKDVRFNQEIVLNQFGN